MDSIKPKQFEVEKVASLLNTNKRPLKLFQYLTCEGKLAVVLKRFGNYSHLSVRKYVQGKI